MNHPHEPLQISIFQLFIALGLIFFVTIAALLVLTFHHIHPFLARNAPISANILVVEGWLPDYALKDAISEFKNGSYSKLITTGSTLSQGYYLAEYNNFAELAAGTLRALGFDANQLIAVPAPEVIKHRTYASAVALKHWLETSDLEVKSINLYSFGPHARRSWLIFQQVLSPNVQVGVMAATPLDYEPQTWWQSSEGVRTVISETIAYIYSKLINWQD
jgi:hypothetical protein